MPDKKSGGGAAGGSQTQVGSMVLYQPLKRDWLRGGGPQIPAIVESYNEETGQAILIVFPTAATMDFVHAATEGDADGQFMQLGEKSKTAQALEEQKKAQQEQQEQQAKKDQEDLKKMQEQAKKQEEKPEGTPTLQAQLDYDQKKATMLYKMGYPAQQEQ